MQKLTDDTAAFFKIVDLKNGNNVFLAEFENAIPKQIRRDFVKAQKRQKRIKKDNILIYIL